ncbi:MAG: putative reductase [Modestobacter sp.]|nr:putative reductase [Modestobacter sp.]
MSSGWLAFAPVQLRIFTEPQMGATYDDLLAVARRTEETGFDAFFRSDHYLTMGGSGLPGPTDAWVTLGGLARETSRIRLGTLMTAATFRLPGPLAISVAQVDQMSGGRVELGIGAGWFAEEHAAYGIPFPELGERFDRYEEQLAVITGLWGTPAGQTYEFAGKHYQVTGSPALPKPVQEGGIPILIGGGGKKRTPRLAARYAAEFNVPFRSSAENARLFDGVRDACRAVDRDPSSLVYSSALVLCVGRNDAEVARRAAAIGRDVDELRANGVAGTPAEAVETLGRYAEAGAGRMYLQVLDLTDLEHLDLVAAEVAPQLG